MSLGLPTNAFPEGDRIDGGLAFCLCFGRVVLWRGDLQNFLFFIFFSILRGLCSLMKEFFTFFFLLFLRGQHPVLFSCSYYRALSCTGTRTEVGNIARCSQPPTGVCVGFEDGNVLPDF